MRKTNAIALAAPVARVVHQSYPLQEQRAQGMPGDGLARVDLFFRMVIAASKSRVLRRPFEPAPGIPCAMVLTVSFALSLGTGLSCPHRKQIALLT
jgi:hypothetical protein